jgi:hypothetical protein
VCRSVASDPAAADFTSVAIQKTPWIGSQSLLLKHFLRTDRGPLTGG